MKSKLLLYIFLLSVKATTGYTQSLEEKKGDKEYDHFAYVDAIETYERIADKGYKSKDMFMKLGNAYYFNANLERAAKWYGQLFEITQDLDPEYYYRYSQSLKSIGQYAKADEMLAKFNEKSTGDSRGQIFKKNRNYLAEIKANSGRYKINNALINSEYSDYGSAISDGKLVFTSARDTGNFSKKKDKWTNQYFTNLYSASIISDTILGAPKKYASNINTKFYESTPVFTKDGKTIYFTRNNFNNGKRGKNGEQITFLKIYKANLVNNEWKNVVDLPFNSDNYSVAHPALSPDQKTLYFSSDMPGSIGQSDLFKVQINEDGTFGLPENLGKTINTEGKETFPFISDDNELYFASDGHPGLGGLDLFVSKIKKDGSFLEVQNIGEPANSPNDDFGYLIDSKTRLGFLSSNRPGGKGSDDIYKFLETRKLNCEQALSGIVTDIETQEILANAKVSLFDGQFNLITNVTSNETGYYEFKSENALVQCDQLYYVRGERSDYNTKEQKIQIPNENGKTDLPIQLEKKMKMVTNGDDLAKTFGIRIIYFDYDKSFIRQDAALELEKILDIMKKYPKMNIDIRSHTDSRGTAEYNDNLSGKRAKSTQDWLVKNGINANRLSAKGYGEKELVNKCSDTIDCTEDEHQENRRSQFIINNL